MSFRRVHIGNEGINLVGPSTPFMNIIAAKKSGVSQAASCELDPPIFLGSVHHNLKSHCKTADLLRDR